MWARWRHWLGQARGGYRSGSRRLWLEPLESRDLLSSTSLPRPDHVVVVMEENHGYSQIIGDTADAPYLNGLAQQGALMTNSFAVAHPSEPNYLALFSGSTQGITDDGTYDFTGPNLAQSLLSAGLTFGG
jgi:acid phosphatase